MWKLLDQTLLRISDPHDFKLDSSFRTELFCLVFFCINIIFQKSCSIFVRQIKSSAERKVEGSTCAYLFCACTCVCFCDQNVKV